MQARHGTGVVVGNPRVMDFLEREGPDGHTLAEFAMLQGATYMLTMLSRLHVEIHRSRRHPGLLIRLACQVRAATVALLHDRNIFMTLHARCVATCRQTESVRCMICCCRRMMQHC